MAWLGKAERWSKPKVQTCITPPSTDRPSRKVAGCSLAQAFKVGRQPCDSQQLVEELSPEQGLGVANTVRPTLVSCVLSSSSAPFVLGLGLLLKVYQHGVVFFCSLTHFLYINRRQSSGYLILRLWGHIPLLLPHLQLIKDFVYIFKLCGCGEVKCAGAHQ